MIDFCKSAENTSVYDQSRWLDQRGLYHQLQTETMLPNQRLEGIPVLASRMIRETPDNCKLPFRFGSQLHEPGISSHNSIRCSPFRQPLSKGRNLKERRSAPGHERVPHNTVLHGSRHTLCLANSRTKQGNRGGIHWRPNPMPWSDPCRGRG